MSESKGSILMYPRLGIAHFCQFAAWGAWAGALSQFASGKLSFTGDQVGSLYVAIPLGAVIAPLFIGPIADRYFAAQKVMALLHFIGGLALILCGYLCMIDKATFPIILGLMMFSGICYMPTMGLINSIIFKHLPSPSKAPYVFVFGTFGWIAVNLFIAAFCGGADTPYFFIVGGGIGIFLALYSLTLPDTPPKGAPAPGEKQSGGGLGVLTLFKDFSFFIFVACAFLASIPACNYFFPAMVPFLTERGYPAPVALTTICQFSELFLIVALPFCIARFGLKNVLLIGMAAWFVRYFCFAVPSFPLAVFGLLLHGFCYPFLYVAAYMYAERVAPAHLKVSAQSMMVFLLLGVGQMLGGWGYGYMREANPPKFSETKIAATQFEGTLPEGIDASGTVGVPIPAWSEAEDSPFQYLDLATQVAKLQGKAPKASTSRSVDLGQLLGKQQQARLTPGAIDAMDESELIQDGVLGGSVRYTKEDLKSLGTAIAEGDENFSLSRSDWFAAQAYDWKRIWTLPAFLILACFLVFLLLGRNPKEEKP